MLEKEFSWANHDDGSIQITIFSLFCDFNGPIFISFMVFYNVGLIGMITMLFVRGLAQANREALTRRRNAVISWFAGIFHILLTIGFILLFVLLFRCLS